ncbi:gelsolin, cytoplasmic [Eurytemora carolleeae]|uniref:gelsolin, cytoplasmic n=1 Tax=Eurytemora carolleeae TaxID=1294199 RepID=UPI000C78D0E3|nr:gelsolin, cytoplasmic [Eurytemora carolleeae]|eukprot:XP_023327211.1 gelsolin, cytoplasmic-like [Eurytemora affinis]
MVFENAGKKEGLEIWRIEDFSPVEYTTGELGKFYIGDSYIILRTQNFGGKLSWTLHFWLGAETSQDESGAAAMLAVELDDQLGGVPVQYREVQGSESAKFVSHFPKGLRYLPGGVKSGFKHVDPDQVEKRLFKVKGKRAVKVEQVDVSVASMNKSDCFMLDCGKGHSILVFMPPGARKMEKFKAIQIANELRDEDHAGDAEVEVVDEFSENMDKFFSELGSGSVDDLQEAEEDTDEASDLTVLREKKMYVLITFEFVSGPPFKQTMLDNTDVFLLVGGGTNIFLWIGKAASKEEKLAAMSAAEHFLKNSDIISSAARIVRILEGLETAMFKQYFTAWNEIDDDSPKTYSNIADWKVEDLHTENMKRIERAAGSTPGFLPDDGTGEKKIWRVENLDLKPVEDEVEHLFGGDSYVIQYTAPNISIIYFWQGLKSTTDERAASAIFAAKMDNEDFGGKAVQIRVVQGQEPRHFLRIFPGCLAIFSGGKASGFKNVHDRDEYDEDGVYLYRIRSVSSDARDARAEQVEEKAEQLSSDDVFLLETKEKNWIWTGKESSSQELEIAKQFFNKFSGSRPHKELLVVDEGNEDELFWTALGGKQEYNQPETKPVLPPRLFHVTKLGSGKTRALEIFNFTKQDLVDDDVMILDTGREIIIWVGKNSTKEEKDVAMKMAEEYLDSDPSYRDSSNTVILQCAEGAEPQLFKSFISGF